VSFTRGWLGVLLTFFFHHCPLEVAFFLNLAWISVAKSSQLTDMWSFFFQSDSGETYTHVDECKYIYTTMHMKCLNWIRAVNFWYLCAHILRLSWLILRSVKSPQMALYRWCKFLSLKEYLIVTTSFGIESKTLNSVGSGPIIANQLS
jgi:hypothetical protein